VSARSHLDLLELGRGLRRAATLDDADSVHGGLCELRNALVEHVRAEAEAFAELSEASAAIIVAGQRRVLELLDQLLLDATDQDVACGCVVAAAEVEAALQRQARLEEILLRNQAVLGVR
jgi:hypothetical protein